MKNAPLVKINGQFQISKAWNIELLNHRGESINYPSTHHFFDSSVN